MTKIKLALILAVFFVNTIYCEKTVSVAIDVNDKNNTDPVTEVSTLPAGADTTVPTTQSTTSIPTTQTPTTKITTTTTTPAPSSTTTEKPTTAPTVPTTPPPPAPNSSTTTTTPPSTPVPIISTTKPPPNKDRHFDGASFIGGIILAVGLMGIGFIAFKFYKARTEHDYKEVV